MASYKAEGKEKCKEIIIIGDDVDLTKLPAPLLNKADRGTTYRLGGSMSYLIEQSHRQTGLLHGRWFMIRHIW